MRPFHQRLARIGLEATAQYGFVLAGGYALSVHGIGDLPSQDIDLFTDAREDAIFSAGRDALINALNAYGLQVAIQADNPGFLDLTVSDPLTYEISDMQLGKDYRAYPPVPIANVGPALDQRDAIAGKMSALWSRGETRDYIDIDAVIRSGLHTRDEVLALGDSKERFPMDRHMLADRFRQGRLHDPSDYARYGIGARQRETIIVRFAKWADSLGPNHDPAVSGRVG